MIYTYFFFFFWKWAHWWRHRHRLDRFRFQNFQSPGLIWFCIVCQCPSPDFADNPLYKALWGHRDKNSMAIGNHYLDFLQMCSLISLVNDNHVDNNLKEILLFVYYGLIVNSRPKKGYPHKFSYFLHKNTLCGYSPQVPLVHSFGLKKHLIWSYWAFTYFHTLWKMPILKYTENFTPKNENF